MEVSVRKNSLTGMGLTIHQIGQADGFASYVPDVPMIVSIDMHWYWMHFGLRFNVFGCSYRCTTSPTAHIVQFVSVTFEVIEFVEEVY